MSYKDGKSKFDTRRVKRKKKRTTKIDLWNKAKEYQKNLVTRKKYANDPWTVFMKKVIKGMKTFLSPAFKK